MIMKKIVLALLCFTAPIFADLDPSVKSPRSENIESVMLVEIVSFTITIACIIILVR